MSAERDLASELVRVAKAILSGLDKKEDEILTYLYGNRTTTPYEIYRKFNLDIKDATAIYDLTATGFGPGGRGEKWMLDQIRKILLRGGYGSSSLDGMSNVEARRKVNDLIAQHTRGIFHDQSWEPINRLWKILNAAAINWTMTGSEYQSDGRGVPTSKRWGLEIEFLNNNAKPTKLYGTVVASGAGSVENPLESYDVVAYVS